MKVAVFPPTVRELTHNTAINSPTTVQNIGRVLVYPECTGLEAG